MRPITLPRQPAMSRFQRFLHDEAGTTSVEYGVLIALILLTTMVGIRTLTNGASGMWQNNNDQLDAVGFNAPPP